MQILIVKMSSLGDVIHLFPALTDAQRAYPNLACDWVVEGAFVDIPLLHPAVREVFPINLRQWRKHPYQAWKNGDFKRFKQLIQHKYYDLVIDAQGLLKSALIARLAHGTKAGFDKQSAREPLASLFYQQPIEISKDQHAIWRLRQLMAAALNYPLLLNLPDYGIRRFTSTTLMSSRPSLIFLHSTTWASKHYPENLWLQLVKIACDVGFQVKLPWGNPQEKARAQRLAASHKFATVMPAMNLQTLAADISTARGVIGVDTGLAHLAAALSVPSVTIYGSTNPALTGTCGTQQIHLQTNFKCSPCLKRECLFSKKLACYETISPKQVWQALLNVL
jgi:heptosyltransferase I